MKEKLSRKTITLFTKKYISILYKQGKFLIFLFWTFTNNVSEISSLNPHSHSPLPLPLLTNLNSARKCFNSPTHARENFRQSQKSSSQRGGISLLMLERGISKEILSLSSMSPFWNERLQKLGKLIFLLIIFCKYFRNCCRACMGKKQMLKFEILFDSNFQFR